MKILLCGYGSMNTRVAQLAKERNHEIVGVLLKNDKPTPFPTYTLENINQLPDADVLIDFSNPELSLPMLVSNINIPIVMATTGEKERLISSLHKKSEQSPVFYSANMSYGVHVLTEIIQYATPLLNNMDVELIERHHNKKVDAPSGTLIKILDAINKNRNVHPMYDRSKNKTERNQEEVGISVVRGGTIVGEHEVLFAGLDETIQIIHRAQSKDIFANGSIDVAEKLINKQNGFYTFSNL
ncbi:4-hydroxy-tetrahydrodipicolinate reductase [Macrococcus armenti]|uniref:4-hydroxy-tetrahydrodipicolinate reductase n=1 Tax=Macrococcus armenti TaxID=2875764 RepID=A0ABY3ZRS5_9STAP|nr:4-hydroxy-tetrahydrodipicolinate reductase [Macrococcus armenti]UOB19594.1 4-hydroxy-tetrahydrodipicolinate reductase [Macrococcus armenti]